MKQLLLVLALIPAFLFAQSKKVRKALEAQQKADQVIISNLKNHIQNLTGGNSSDQNSTAGFETKAVEYISTQFKSIGLQPKGTNGFTQQYRIEDGKKIEPSTYLKVSDKKLEINNDFFPLSYSAEKKVKGMPAMALRERGVPWFADLKDWLEDGSKVQGGKIEDVIKKEAAKVAAKGATALFVYNSGTMADGLTFNSKDKTNASPIPVVYITPAGLKKYFNDRSEMLDLELNVAFRENILNGSNIIGSIDNGVASTIVIGAHYFFGSPASVTELIAAGADDNGSGIATLIELARMLAVSKAKNNNYLFVAFGGPDKGSIAANYWLDNSSNTSPINYMVNLDMVGSYSDGKKLLVHGYNTSPVWNELFTTIADKKLELTVDSGNITTDPAASFYKKGIPELSFSSASHADYASGTDDESKINYPGILQITKFISRLVETTDTKGKIAFAKSPQNTPAAKVAETAVVNAEKADEATLATSTKTTVSLGVIPDRSNSETGLKISGVTPKKLASKLGLQPGDVLTNLGTYPISDLKSYMHALSNFKAGDKTTLRIKRGKDDKEFAVQF